MYSCVRHIMYVLGNATPYDHMTESQSHNRSTTPLLPAVKKVAFVVKVKRLHNMSRTYSCSWREFSCWQDDRFVIFLEAADAVHWLTLVKMDDLKSISSSGMLEVWKEEFVRWRNPSLICFLLKTIDFSNNYFSIQLHIAVSPVLWFMKDFS